jgi:predicted dehydrogenase
MTRAAPPALRSVAIAGAWGYIGRKFVDAALALGLDVHAYDPGPPPADVDRARLHVCGDERAFFRTRADLFHLALHPEHRRRGFSWLLERAQSDPLLILNEKPMAAPQRPGECAEIEHNVARSRAVVLYDFPELYDELTACILDYLRQFRAVEVREMVVTRSKDREDPANPRNAKRMVTIQYQESVHCLAFVLHLLGRLHGGAGRALDRGVTVAAEAQPYVPPNPEVYPGPVDGRCRFTLAIGPVRVSGDTNFKRGAPWAKRRELRGVADGRPFAILVDYLEGHKQLTIDGAAQPIDPRASSYEQVFRTAARWRQTVAPAELAGGVYPNPPFARLTYQLSAALWRSSRGRTPLRFASAKDLLAFDARYPTDSTPDAP